MVRVRVVYVGRVQGVGFRATTRSIAQRFPVTGWVRNEPDGSVRMEAQGEASAVGAFRAAVRERLARFVRSEVAEDVGVIEGEPEFTIQR